MALVIQESGRMTINIATQSCCCLHVLKSCMHNERNVTSLSCKHLYFDTSDSIAGQMAKQIKGYKWPLGPAGYNRALTRS
jgi:hypothetical protein